MIRYLFIFSSLFPVVSQAQLITGSETNIIVGSQSKMSVDGQAILNGSLKNNGNIKFYHDVDFGSIKHAGNISIDGNESQSLFGQSIIFDSLRFDNQAGVSLFLDSAIVKENMNLAGGIIYTNASILKSSNGEVSNSTESFIEGSLAVDRAVSGNQFFPMGRDGFYNPISLSNIPAGASIKVTMITPNLDFPVSGDTLIGVASEHAWQIEYQGESTFSFPTLQFNGFDLSDLITESTIRAPEYKPVIACLPPSPRNYHPMKTASLTNTDNRTFGSIAAGQSIPFTSGGIYQLGIGLRPSSPDLQFYVPNVFTPGSSKRDNQFFRPFLEGTDIQFLEMTIWDQFNNVVFQKSYTNPDMQFVGWDGFLSNGKEAPEGAYFYSIALNSTDGSFNRKSTVFLTK